MTKRSAHLSVFTGRFGSGKTEIALNSALRLAEQGLHPLLIDLDIVTPYFRIREKVQELSQLGVQVITPFAVGQHVDIPAISPQIKGALEQLDDPVLIDLGGDRQGARALSQYAPTIAQRDYAMYMVVNPYRPFVDSVAGIHAAIDEIQESTRLRVTALVSNPNLMSASTPELFLQGHQLVQEAGQALDLPIAFAAISETLAAALDHQQLNVELMVIHRFFLMLDTST